MIGQGSPTIWRGRHSCADHSVIRGWIGIVLIALSGWIAIFSARSAAAADSATGIRVAWGGGATRQWRGRITIAGGSFLELRPLGVEADEPGSMWIAEGVVNIRQRSRRSYDGADIFVANAGDATITVQLDPLDGQQPDGSVETPVEISLASLGDEHISHRLDDQGNHITLRRTPGDQLKLDLNRDALIFEPGERWRFHLTPQIPGAKRNWHMLIRADLSVARESRSEWSEDVDYFVGSVNQDGHPAGLDLEVPLPEREGVYDLTITASRMRFNRLVPAKSLASRKVQIIVVAPQVSSSTTTQQHGWTLVEEIDPASPTWLDRVLKWPQFGRIPGFPTGPLGSGDAKPWLGPLGNMIRLEPKPGRDQASWQAYPISIRKPSIPHMIEVDYPSHVPQDLGISIVEPNSSGMVLPIGLDSGVFVPDRSSGDATVHSHRLIFWPKTKSPLLLFTNRHEAMAVFGKIRVLESSGSLPRAYTATAETEGRLIAGYLDRPLFPENFSATDQVDEGIQQSVDDWQTFYEGSVRLIEYLKHVGYNGLMISALADGSTIYPSELLEPTPWYDTGVLATTGQDPVRKDVLELMFRLFDREGLRLIPSLQFAAPLPAMEERLRDGQAQNRGLEWLGPDGATWLERNSPQRGLAPYYNTLNHHVQKAMLDVVHELVQRYGHHPSFGGLALQLDAVGYAQLVGPEWGMDDPTVSKFERDMQLRVPGAGPERFAARAQFLLGPQRQQWLDWRAAELARFYSHVHGALARLRPGVPLYLTTSHLFDHPHLKHELRPKLPDQAKIIPTLLKLGIQPNMFRENPEIVLLRPQLLGSPRPLAARGVEIQINSAVGLDQELASLPRPGGIFFHKPERLKLPEFDKRSPFGAENTYTRLASQYVPSNYEYRRRFVHSLATLDVRAIFDGGYLLPMGQEDMVRRWFNVYRQLPVNDFETKSIVRQPVTIRTLSRPSETWIYLVNDSPWTAQVNVPLVASPSCLMSELGKQAPARPVANGQMNPAWKLTLEPYDLAAARFSEGRVTVRNPQVEVAKEVEVELDLRIRDIGARAASLRNQPTYDALQNADFELTGPQESIPGWELLNKRNGMGAELDSKVFYRPRDSQEKGHSVQLWSHGVGASLQSELIDIPKTGRIAVAVRILANDTARQGRFRLFLEDPQNGQTYRRFAALGNQPGQQSLQEYWVDYIIPFDDLPVDRFHQIRLRFDFLGKGKVWIDDVRLYSLSFAEIELKGLTKIIASARQFRENGQLSDCLRVLEGYWPRFLVENVPRVETPAVKDQRRANELEPRPTEPNPRWTERVKSFVPFWK